MISFYLNSLGFFYVSRACRSPFAKGTEISVTKHSGINDVKPNLNQDKFIITMKVNLANTSSSKVYEMLAL